MINIQYSGRSAQVQALVDSVGKPTGVVGDLSILDETTAQSALDFSGPKKLRLLVTDNCEARQMMDHVVDRQIRHIVQLSNLDCQGRFAGLVKLLVQPQLFFTSPVASLLVNPQPIQFAEPIFLGQDRYTLIEQLREYLYQVPKSNLVVDSALMIATEIVMNAMIDGPKFYKAKYGDMPAHLSGSNQIGTLFAAFDEKKLLVCAIDHFGSMDSKKLMQRLHETFVTDMVSLNFSEDSGAGIGCRTIFELSTESFFVVQPGVRTFVGACLPVGMSQKKQAIMPKNIHVLDVD